LSAAWERLWYPNAPEDVARKLAMAPLSAAALAFGAAVRVRNALYDRGALAVRRVEGARVISVGNLAVGGTGKTPVVIYLADRLVQAGQKVAVLSRGYGRTVRASMRVTGDCAVAAVGDEPLLIARRCPSVPVWVGPDRFELALRARAEGAQVLLLDDGMQHRRLARDAEIVVVDGAGAFGNGWMLPRGPLREPPSALSRASLVWIREVDPHVAIDGWSGATVRALHRPTFVRGPDGSRAPANALYGRRVYALAGLARPERFRKTLEGLGADVAGTAFLADHHAFTAAELGAAAVSAKAASAEIVTTEKDAVRLPPGFSCSVVELEVQVMEGGAELDRCLACG
jgi:tetraacyldisaccharide 4'-kinase